MIKKYQTLFLILLAYITVFAFYPSIKANFINLDDSVMVTENSYITSLSFDNIKHIFTSSHYRLYHPMVTLSYAVEYFVCGLDPYLYHVDNIFLHVFNVLLVFFIIKSLTKSFFISYLTALFFALHPVCVESVAWVTARKDNLYAFFFLLSIFAYLKADESKRYNLFFTASLFLFLCSCLSKPTAVTLPVILLITDFYRNKLSLKNVKKYVPFFVISAVFIYIAVFSHYSLEEKAITTIFVRSINFINAHFNVLFYMYKFVLPVNLSCLYPHFYSYHCLTPWYILYSPALLYLIMFFVFFSLKINKKIFFGFFFFLTALLPSSGIMPTGVAPVADRYVYVAYIGLCYISAEFLFFIYKKHYLKYFVLFFILCINTILFYLTYQRNVIWADNKKLMTQAVNYSPEKADHAYLLRGCIYKNEKKLLLAKHDLEKSNSINRENAYTVYHLAHLNQLQNNFNEALRLYSYIPESSVNFIPVINNTGVILDKQEQTDKAIALMKQVMDDKKFSIPDYFYHTLAIFYYKRKNIDEALKYINIAVTLNPSNYIYYMELISLYREKNDFENLEKAAFKGLKNTDGNVNIVNELAKEYFSAEKYEQTEKLLLENESFNPGNEIGYFFLGNIFAIKGEYKKALTYYTMAIITSKSKDNGEYYFKRAAVYMLLNKYELALKDVVNAEKRNFKVEESFKKDLKKIKEKRNEK